MMPSARRQRRRPVDELLSSTVTFIAKRTVAVADPVLRRQVHVVGRSGTEIEDPHPVAHGIQIHPGRYRHGASSWKQRQMELTHIDSFHSDLTALLLFLPAAQVAPFTNVPFQPLPVTSFAVVPLVSLNGSFANRSAVCPFMTCVILEAAKARL